MAKGAKKSIGRNATVYVVRVAIMAAMLTVLKLALSFVPNVEVVTLLILVYGAAMGAAYAVPATLVFCAVEVALYGAGSWVLLYFIYWPLLAVAASILLKGRRVWLAAVLAAFGGVLFGVLSACCDTLFCVTSLAPAHLGDYWVAYYLKGLYFDLAHIASGVLTVCLLYLPLVSVLRRLAPYAVGEHVCGLKSLRHEEYKRMSPYEDVDDHDDIVENQSAAAESETSIAARMDR